MTTEKLYEFVVLSRTLNYSAAAENLYITQSTLTKHIQALEKELGTRLFERSTHGIVLTASGALLAQEALGLIDQCNHAVNLLQLQNLPTRGRIRIALAYEVSYAAHIQVFVGRFMERYPDIDVELEVKCDGTAPNILSDYDFVFTPCEYQLLPNNMTRQLVKSHGVYLAIYPGHPLLSKSLLSLRELAGETLIIPFADEVFGPYAKNLILAKKYTHDNVNHIPVGNLATALFLVSIGKGITLVPRYARHVIPSNIFMIGISNEDARFNEYLYYNQAQENGAARLFFEEFMENMQLNLTV